MKLFLLRGVVSWLMQLPANATSPERAPSAECQNSFSLRNATSAGLMNSEADEYRGMTVLGNIIILAFKRLSIISDF